MEATITEIAGVRPVGQDAVAVDIATPPGFAARPGQFVKVSARLDDGRASRFYTVSSPRVSETFEITVAVDPDGTLGPWLADRQAGAAIEVAGPFGTDYYDGESRVVTLAGGPGVGPALGVAERAIRDGGAAAVVYRDDAVVHEDRLAALARSGVPVYVLLPGGDVRAATAAAMDGGGQVFIFGFADFLDIATEAVEAAGWDAANAKVENFG